MQSKAASRSGMLPFITVVVANLVSLTGTQMTRFAVVTWAWKVAGSATAAGLVMMANLAATVLVSIFAGALVDRWSRKWTIIGADIVGFLVTIGVMALYDTNNLHLWHLGALGALAGMLESIQFPAYMASVTTMVAKENYARANGLFQFVWTFSVAVAPAMTALVLGGWGMNAVLILDLVSYVVVILCILSITIPQPAAPEGGHGSIWQDVAAGFRYIAQRGSLLGMLLILMTANIACGFYEGLFRPMVLALFDGDVSLLGYALTAGSVGGVVGGLLMGVWGGPKTKMPMLLGSVALMSGLGLVLLALGRSLLVWGVAGSAYGFFLAVANTLIFAIWQVKVDPALQGRVFTTMRLVVMASGPVAVLAATQMADRIF
ncbi:MAG TPA: MFS transporter, partial [Symbiobacteriaceae bacterium]|nr:MFS transporter [Symbiobacteriaceae bacterium]